MRVSFSTLGLIFVLSLFVAGAKRESASAQRFSSIIGLRTEKIDEYKKLHAAIWPGVAKMIRDCHIHNYSIYLKKMDDGQYYLFSYFEYVGQDFKADMAKMAADTTTQRWWKFTNACQRPIKDRKPGEFWASMEEVFHQD